MGRPAHTVRCCSCGQVIPLTFADGLMVGHVELDVLDSLIELGGSAMLDELAEHTGRPENPVGKSVRGLIDKGLAERVGDWLPRRGRRVEITEAGRAAHAARIDRGRAPGVRLREVGGRLLGSR